VKLCNQSTSENQADYAAWALNALFEVYVYQHIFNKHTNFSIVKSAKQVHNIVKTKWPVPCRIYSAENQKGGDIFMWLSATIPFKKSERVQFLYTCRLSMHHLPVFLYLLNYYHPWRDPGAFCLPFLIQCRHRYWKGRLKHLSDNSPQFSSTFLPH